MLFKDALGIALRRIRVSRGLKLRDVASKSGVSLGYLSEIENGRKEVSSDFLFWVCEAIGWSLPDVLDEVSNLMRESDLVSS
jgi:transcriptional regulator with XRE-family HTH domain